MPAATAHSATWQTQAMGVTQSLKSISDQQLPQGQQERRKK
jgi:hypothetical protein